jgi:uncharacterized integral membrane protein (TIGR00698 family)
MLNRVLFITGLVISASGFVSPPEALVLGLLFGFTMTHPYLPLTKKLTKTLLQASVVGLGFGMNLQQVLRVGRSGFVYTFLGITFVMILGMLLGKLLRVEKTPAFLISAGTAICGGSAIAAVGPVSNASDEEIAVSLGTVFVLNSVALLTFPAMGSSLHMTQTQFGLWAALAIHDTSSVVGAADKYGATALMVGTTVKLARALWIVPLTLGSATVFRNKAKIQWPWFIGFFLLAAVCNTYLAAAAPLYRLLSHLGKLGLTVTLFLIGSGLSLATLKRVGPRPLLQGVTLWIIVSIATLYLILTGWVAL